MRQPPETRGFFAFGGLLFVLGAIIAVASFTHRDYRDGPISFGPADLSILVFGAAMTICGAVFLGVGKIGAEIHRQGMN